MALTREESIVVDTFYFDHELEDRNSAEEFLVLNGYDVQQEELKFKKLLEAKKSELGCFCEEEVEETFDPEYTEI